MIMDTNLINRYSRHLLLSGFGKKEQVKLSNARVLIIGCGGLASPVIQYLSAAGIGYLTLCDGDSVELSNLNRQTLYCEADVGKNKAKCAAEFIFGLNPNICVNVIEQHLEFQSIRAVVKQHDLILDCTDGLPIKFLINDSCVIEDKILIHGAASAFEGRLLTVKGSNGPCLRCIFEDIPPIGSVLSCSRIGILGPVCGVIGSIMSIEVIHQILGIKKPDYYWVWDFSLSYEAHTFPLLSNENCKACGNRPEILSYHEDKYNMQVCID